MRNGILTPRAYQIIADFEGVKEKGTNEHAARPVGEHGARSVGPT